MHSVSHRLTGGSVTQTVTAHSWQELTVTAVTFCTTFAGIGICERLVLFPVPKIWGHHCPNG